MADQNNKVFISYRREPTKYLAHSLFKELGRRGFDVFWDIEGIGAAKFERVILAEILARPFFVVLLSHGTLDRVYEAKDWLRREIEYAIEHKRIIVPVLIDCFSFKDAMPYLQTGLLTKLPEYNAISFYAEYFDAGVDKLCKKYLVLDDTIPKLKPLSIEISKEAEEIIEDAIEAPEPTEEELSAEELFRRAFEKLGDGDENGAITDLKTIVIEDTADTNICIQRGLIFLLIGEYENAMQDFNIAIEFQPDNTWAYHNRGLCHSLRKEYKQAIVDYDKALELNHENVLVFSNRAKTYRMIGDFEQAIADYNNAIELNADYIIAYSNRGDAYAEMGNFEQAIYDYNKAIELNPDDADAYHSRGDAYAEIGNFEQAIQDFTKLDFVHTYRKR